MPAESRQEDEASVRHLVELGYVDPNEVTAAKAAVRARLKAELRRAVELISQHRSPEAIQALNQLTLDDPDWIAPRRLLAEVHYQAGDRNETRAHLDWLADHGVVAPRLALIAGAMALARRDNAAALEELEYASHADPTLACVQTLLGTARMRLGQWDAAAAALQLAVRQNPADACTLDGLAALALHGKDFEGAAQWALEAVQHDMNLFRAHYHLGIALAHLDRTEAAAAAFETSARLQPSRGAPFYWLSRIARDHRGDAVASTEYRVRGLKIIRQRRGGAGE